MKIRGKYNLIALLMVMLAMQAVLPFRAFAATYVSQAVAVSADLLSGTSASGIANFHYNLASLPAGSSVRLQFSKDNASWYSAGGASGEWTTISAIGGADLDLAAFVAAASWASGDSFYYKLELNATPDLTQTPAVEDIRLDYTPAAGYEKTFIFDDYGRVGIGTTAPWYTLDVNGTINADFYRVGGVAALGTTGGKVYVGSAADYDFGIYAGAADRLFIQNSTGNVGIGTTSPGSLLHLNGALGALSGGLAFGDGDTGLYENYDDNFRLQTAGVDRITIDDTGNVGIGTTAPSGLLHVAGGQCVTGDTLLRVRRRRKRQNERGEWVEEEYFEDCRIDQIKAGDEILTLDENTGRLVVSRVNALMDMGVKEIYKLTTATGKTIRTTANHPYLAVDGFDNERAAVFVDSANFEMSCRFCGLEKDYVKMDKFFFGAMKKSAKTFRFYKVDFGGNKQRKFFDFLNIIGAKIVSKPIKVIKQKQKANEHKANFDVELAVDAVELKEKYDTAIIVSGDSDFAYLAEHLQKAGKKTVVISPWRRTGKELRQQADMYFDLRNMPFVGRIKIKRPPVGGINPGFSPALTILSQVHPFVKGAGRWTKVSQLREGQMIAVAGDNAKPQYERIAKIEKLPAEQVYDIEVAGTHNFVGNGIVAHNTYLQGADQLNTSFALRVQDSAGADKFVVTNAGRVGIGTTSPAYTLDVNGGFRAGNATSTNALVFDPGTGNVGVGTASPVQKLHVEGHCITGDSELAIVSPPNQEEQIRKIQIKDVQPGTQVLTLNEQTNRLEARAINKLLDMGVQAVFRLTTSSGKTIRTTGNHPYLAKISSAEQQQRISLREIGAMEREYGIDKNGLSVDREFSQTKTIWAGESEIAATKKPACADSWTSSDSVQISGLSPNAIIADAPILSMAAASRRDFRVVEVGGIEPPNPWVTIQSSHRATPTTSELYHENDDGAKWTKVIYLSVGDEIATVSLDHRLSNSEPEVSWEKISSIEYVGQEQVYDIEVAGTHNFVANEILAHNTYISGNVGIGTASPAEALDVNGRVRLAQTIAPETTTDRLYNVSGNLLWNGVNLTAGGALPVGTEGQMLYNNAGAWTAFDGLYWDDTTSRLGIGTTAPIYKFNVAGANASTDVGDASLLGIVNTDTTANNTIGFAFGQANLSGTIQTVAGIDLVGVSHADGAQSGALAFSTRNAGSWSERLRIDNTGNVGIGTTAPSGLLHVAGGQCVTGDTLLRVRRRRKRQNERGEWVEEEYFEDCRIDQIKAGDEILTLDENTGRLAVSRVNALMDMGVKEIYKLTTATGKTIRTTANHPYLARKPKSQKPRAGVFIDSANLYFAAKKAEWKIDYKKLSTILRAAFDIKFVNFYVALPKSDDAAYEGTQRYLNKFSSEITIKAKPLKYIVDDNQKEIKKGDVDIEIALDVVRTIGDLDLAIVVSGDSDYLELAEYVEKEKNKQIAFVGFKKNMAWELRLKQHLFVEKIKSVVELGVTKNPAFDGATLTASLYRDTLSFVKSDAKFEPIKQNEADPTIVSAPRFMGSSYQAQNCVSRGDDGQATKNPSFSTGESPCGDSSLATAISSLSGNLPFVKGDDGGKWTKVADICEGMEIATADENSGRAVWERIAKIEKLPAEQVYDIEVEGTHNFVGNGIVAHNTYLQGADQLNTSFALRVQDSASADKFVITNAGNIGIGTTTPGAKLDIVAGNLDLDNTTNANQFGAITKNGTLFIHDFNYGNNGTVTTDGYNTFIGSDAGNLTMGSTASETWHASFNTGVGANALFSNTTGYANSAFGSNALLSNTTGSNNFAMGNNAGRYYGSGTDANQASSNSLFVGYDTRANAAGGTNEIVIGASAIGAGSNSVVLGNDSIIKTLLKGSVGIGTTDPAEALDVNGRVRLAQTTAPETTADRLYNVSGNLLWNGVNLTAAGALPVGTEGQMLYNNAGAWTAFDGLYWDDATSRLGIGTTSPVGKLVIKGTGVSTGIGLQTQNSSATPLFTTLDNGTVIVGSSVEGSITRYLTTPLTPQLQIVAAGPDASFLMHRYSNTVNSGRIFFLKTRGVSPTDFASVDQNDELGGFSWAGGNGTVAAEGARISVTTASANSGDDYTAANFDFYTSPGGSTSVRSRMRISSSGNVGIGTTSPAYTLDVNGGFRAGNATSTNALVFDPSTGNVGVGTSAPTQKLEVNGSLIMTGDRGDITKTGLYLYDSGATSMIAGYTNTGGVRPVMMKGNYLGFYTGSSVYAENMRIDSSGNIGIGTTSPGYKLAIQSEASETTLGSNLLTNGDFANDFTGWTAGANWAAATGAAVHTAGSVEAISQDITVTTGQYYQIDYTETGDTAGSLTFAIGSASVTRAYWHATSVTIKTSGSTGTQTFSITPTSTYNGTLDNITVKLVTPAATPAFVLLNADGTAGGVQIKAGGSGLNNIFIGLNSGRQNTTGNFNNALGANSLYSNTTGNHNNALGREAGRYNETGSENNYFGYRAGGYGAGAVNSHSGTTAVGSYALYNLTTGNYNLGLGYKAGENLTSGSGNVIIGYDIDAPSATASNQLNIGNLIFGTGLDGRNATLSSGNVGIGTTAPTGKLTVRGDSSGAAADLLRLENLGTAAIGSGGKLSFINNITGDTATTFGEIIGLATGIGATDYSGALQFKIAANGLLETVAEFGSANIVLNRPLQVNVAGDTGISYDLQFMNTGVSNIVSNGPLTISAGTIYRADNLTLTTRANEQAGDFGTAATTTATTLTDSGKAWTADEWIGGTITIVAGAGKGQTQTVTDNDATVITVADWDATLGDPSANSVYRLSYAPAGDVLANIANANAIFGGFKVLGNDNGGYAFRVAPDGSVHIGGEGAGESSLFVKQNITAYGGILSLRQLDISSAGTPVATTATSGGSCADSTAYYYKVTAINGNGETTGTAQFTVTTGKPGTNTNLNTIAWSAVTGATGYKIYRSTENNDWDGDANDQWVDGKVVAAPAITYDDDCAGDTASLTPPTANTTGGKLAINTAGVSPTRRFEVLENTGAAPQMKIISDASNYSEFYVDATGDLSLKLTGSGGDDLILLDENLKICASGDFGSVSCPTAGFTISGTGNLIVENKVIADKFEQICPTGYVWVPGSAKHGTLPGFCVMKYEAKDAGGGVAESKAADAPWTSVTQENARAYCQALGEGYHLVSEAEWMTIAENIAATPINDIDAVAGLQLATGHTDNDPANSLAAGTDPVVSGCNLRLPLSDAANAFDADCQLRDNGGEVYGYSGTGGNFWNDIGYLAGGNNKSQLRVHALSNGNTVWDIAGNVWEWTDAIISQVDQPGISNDGGAGVGNWGEWNVAYYLTGAAANSRPPDDGWTGANGIGRLYTYGRDETATTTYRAFLRGGNWTDTSYAGVFALNLNNSPAHSYSSIGFRCAR